MDHPGQRFQIDVKYVPSSCLKNSNVIGKKFFQYTAIDEYSRWRFVEAFEEHSSYSSAIFLEHLVKAFPAPLSVFRQTTVPNSQTVLLLLGINLPFFRNIWNFTALLISSSNPTHPGITARWSAATVKTMRGSMPPTLFIPLMILLTS